MTKLVPNDGVLGDNFGRSCACAIFGSTIVMCTFKADGKGAASGVVYYIYIYIYIVPFDNFLLDGAAPSYIENKWYSFFHI